MAYSKRKLIILGAGGTSLQIMDTIINSEFQLDQEYEVVGFLDDNKNLLNNDIHGIKVLGTLRDWTKFTGHFFINGIGNPNNYSNKQSLIYSLRIPLDSFVSIIHKNASISSYAKIGKGVFIGRNVVVEQDVNIANHVVILGGSIINHNVMINDYCSIASGVCISSNVKLMKSCYLGANCSVIQNVEIGENSLIGIGSVVLHNIEANAVYVGNPAHFLRKV